MRDWVFGIDGGGTASRIRIEAADGALLYLGEAGGTNPAARPRKDVERAIAELFSAAFAATPGIAPSGCLAGFAASAGIDDDRAKESFAGLIEAAIGLACPIAAGNDAEAALAGALGEAEGMLLIAGTGSIAFGRLRSGESARAGGWGHLLGDEGSAYWIALQAVSRALRSSEGRDRPTSLLASALGFFGADGPADLLPIFYGGRFDKAAVARFAPAVGKARDDGDELAAEIFDRAEEELTALVASVRSRLGSRLGKPRLAFAGGLLLHDDRLRAGLVRRIAKDAPDMEIVEALSDAAAGACALARGLIDGWPPDPQEPK